MDENMNQDQRIEGQKVPVDLNRGPSRKFIVGGILGLIGAGVGIGFAVKNRINKKREAEDKNLENDYQDDYYDDYDEDLDPGDAETVEEPAETK